ncbi:MAG TPA: alpha/beta fold hydrolase [Magnetospirillaceae bacterium]|nr:alpha/beta fold hydrolase [Magnetospirillaceae bacterium]
MKLDDFRWTAVIGAALYMISSLATAADYPAPQQADWVARNFKFHDGQVLPDLKLHYTTIGSPANPPVVILHGTGGSGTKLLTPAFAGTLFGPGQPLDAGKYFIILPDAIGHGASSKPSDGLRTKFPKFNYVDLVEAQQRLVEEGLGIHHLRLVMGYSMGGMETWLWGGRHPGFMDALVPMASQPSPMSSRNWMLRRMLIETIKNDPGYQDGNYTEQPREARIAYANHLIASAGGTLAYQALTPTREQADKYVDDLLAGLDIDANDLLYAYSASSDYDPSPDLGRITARTLAINSADDERNPPETGIMDKYLAQVKGAKLLLVPASTETRGHGTLVMAKFYAGPLKEFLAGLPE